MKLVSKHPEDPSALARLIGYDESLAGVKVEFHGFRGEEDSYYNEIGWQGEREEFEEFDDEVGDIWSASWNWNIYAKNCRFGKTPERLSSVSFTKGGSKVEVEPTDLFSEYDWDTIVEGYKEAVEVGESWISV